MISTVVKWYEDYQEKKLNDISTAALVVEANLRKAVYGLELNDKQKKHLENALADLRSIQNELTKMDFKLKEEN